MPGQMMGRCHSTTCLGEAGGQSSAGCPGLGSPQGALGVGMVQTHVPIGCSMVQACPAGAGRLPRGRAAEQQSRSSVPGSRERLAMGAAGSAQVRCTTLGWAIYSSAESLLRQQISESCGSFL